MKFIKKPYVYCIVYTIIIALLSAFVLLDTFVIPRKYDDADSKDFMTADNTFSFGTSRPIEDTVIGDTVTQTESDVFTSVAHTSSEIKTDFESNAAPPEDTDTAASDQSTEPIVTAPPETDPPEPQFPVIKAETYQDDNIKITFQTVRYCDTDVHFAHVEISSAEYFKTALAKDSFGTNIREKTSSMAKRKGAILAINGDYYGANKKGYVIKNGTLYRDSIRSDDESDDLIVKYDGSFEIINENNVSAKELLSQGVYQLFGFGPTLVYNGDIKVRAGDEVSVATSSNPRTAIGIVDSLHYVFLVSDGRTSNNKGLSLLQLAEFMHSQGCTTAYNLDGGGSSTMYFNGEIVNNPVASGSKTSERLVSDIVYIGY